MNILLDYQCSCEHRAHKLIVHLHKKKCLTIKEHEAFLTCMCNESHYNLAPTPPVQLHSNVPKPWALDTYSSWVLTFTATVPACYPTCTCAAEVKQCCCVCVLVRVGQIEYWKTLQGGTARAFKDVILNEKQPTESHWNVTVPDTSQGGSFCRYSSYYLLCLWEDFHY